MPMRAQSSPSMMYAPATSDPNLIAASQPVVALRRSALGVFGWLVLAAVLFGGVGALLYVALGERNAPKVSDTPSGTGSAKEVEVKVVLPNPDGARGSADAANRVPDAVTSSSGAGDDIKPDPSRDGKKPADDKSHKRPPVRTGAIKRPGTNDDKEPRSASALVQKAKSFEKAGQWNEARAVWQKLEKVKGYNLGEALYHQAWAAFQAKSTGDAAQLAAEAAGQPGPFKVKAQFLYGDAWYRLGDHAHAKSIYIKLRNTVTGDERATATKMISLCNKALKLPETDGVTD